LADHAQAGAAIDTAIIEHPARRRADALDPVTLCVDAAIGEGRIGLGHFQRADFDGAQRH
jgi:hypothetical protein